MVVGLFCHTVEADEQFDGPISRSFDERPNLEDRMFTAIGVENGLPFVQLDQERIHRVVEKIVKGLLFLELKDVDVKDKIFRIISFESEKMPDFTGHDIEKREFNKRYSPDFVYRHMLNPDQLTHSIWHTIFYESFHCICIVSEGESEEAAEQGVAADAASRRARSGLF